MISSMTGTIHVIEALIAFIVSLVITGALWGVVYTIEGAAQYVDLIHLLFILIDGMTLIVLCLSIIRVNQD